MHVAWQDIFIAVGLLAAVQAEWESIRTKKYPPFGFCVRMALGMLLAFIGDVGYGAWLTCAAIALMIAGYLYMIERQNACKTVKQIASRGPEVYRVSREDPEGVRVTAGHL